MKIKEIGTVITGKTPSTKIQGNFDGNIPFATPEDIAKGFIIHDTVRHISEQGFESIKNNTFDGPSVMVGCIGSDMGNVALSMKRFSSNQQINTITKIKPFVNPYYVYYFLSTKKDYLRSLAGSTATPLLPKSDFEEIDIPLPDKQTQDNVANLLKTIDLKLSNNNDICSKLESMAKLLYDHWFIQFDFPDENGKPYKSSGGTMTLNEELKREIPEGWEVKHVSDLTKVKTGKEDANFATANGDFAYFTCGHDVLRCDEYAFEGSAILLAGNGDFNVKHYTGKFNAYQRTYVLIPDESKYHGLLYMATKDAITRLTMGSVGSIVKFITLDDVNGITLLDPKNDSILERFNTIVCEIERIQLENNELIELRDFLLPMLINGQIKVNSKS